MRWFFLLFLSTAGADKLDSAVCYKQFGIIPTCSEGLFAGETGPIPFATSLQAASPCLHCRWIRRKKSGCQNQGTESSGQRYFSLSVPRREIQASPMARQQPWTNTLSSSCVQDVWNISPLQPLCLKGGSVSCWDQPAAQKAITSSRHSSFRGQIIAKTWGLIAPSLKCHRGDLYDTVPVGFKKRSAWRSKGELILQVSWARNRFRSRFVWGRWKTSLVFSPAPYVNISSN